MKRLCIALIFLLFAARAPADNVLMKANGAGAAGAGMIAATAGALALAPPPQWQGYDRNGDDGIHSPSADNSVGQWLRDGKRPDCVAANSQMAGLAKALKDDKPAAPASEGQIHLQESQAHGTQATAAEDPKAVYAEGQTVTCPSQ